MPGVWPKPIELVFRLALCYALLIWLSDQYGRAIVAAMLPVFAATLGALDDHYRVVSLAIGSEGADTVIRLRVCLARIVVIGGQVIMPHPLARAEVTTAIGTVMQAPLIATGLIIGWPANSAIEFISRIGLAASLLAIVLLVDTPFVLWAYLWDMHVQAYDPDIFSPLLLWEGFLGHGGRGMLGIVMAAVALVTAKRLSGRLLSAKNNDPVRGQGKTI